MNVILTLISLAMNCAVDTVFSDQINQIYDNMMAQLAQVADQDPRLKQVYCMYLKCPDNVKMLFLLGGLTNAPIPTNTPNPVS